MVFHLKFVYAQSEVKGSQKRGIIQVLASVYVCVWVYTHNSERLLFPPSFPLNSTCLVLSHPQDQFMSVQVSLNPAESLHTCQSLLSCPMFVLQSGSWCSLSG
ncbi:hypothetical protein AMECASPLE_038307 [Ameca splendens]|uniref:Uncharacterized protein n=1 Tax=Ameca splendens TaxID=208324 RepID=A0ABV1AFI0_9TELE